MELNEQGRVLQDSPGMTENGGAGVLALDTVEELPVSGLLNSQNQNPSVTRLKHCDFLQNGEDYESKSF